MNHLYHLCTLWCAVTGTMRFTANEFFSYYIDMTARIEGTDIQTSNRIHLKDQVQCRAC
jgi:hypothetical protein